MIDLTDRRGEPEAGNDITNDPLPTLPHAHKLGSSPMAVSVSALCYVVAKKKDAIQLMGITLHALHQTFKFACFPFKVRNFDEAHLLPSTLPL